MSFFFQLTLFNAHTVINQMMDDSEGDVIIAQCVYPDELQSEVHAADLQRKH